MPEDRSKSATFSTVQTSASGAAVVVVGAAVVLVTTVDADSPLVQAPTNSANAANKMM